MRTRPQLEGDLERARTKLETLPPAHHHDHPAIATARRAALEARIAWLENEIERTPDRGPTVQPEDSETAGE